MLLLLMSVPLFAFYAWLLVVDQTMYRAAIVGGVAAVVVLTAVIAPLRHVRWVRLIYLGGAAAMVATALVYPLWRGVRYSSLSSEVSGNAMDVERRRAFLWQPPRVFDQTAFREAPVHWPFDLSPEGVYAEPMFTFSFIGALAGITALGLVVSWWYRRHSDTHPDIVLHIGLRASTMMLLGCLCVLVIGVLSMGYILFEPRIILGILATSVLVGVIWAMWTLPRLQPVSRVTLASGVAPTPTDVTIPALESREPASTGQRVVRVLLTLVAAWFVLNVIGVLAMAVLFPAGAVMLLLAVVVTIAIIIWLRRKRRRAP